MKKVKVKRDFDLHQMVTDKIIAKLEEGVVPWRKPWQTGKMQ
jgi:antirestriction protein ArdC